MPYLIVEYEHTAPVSEQDLGKMATALIPCLEVRNIRKLRSVLSDDGRRGYCEFEAPDAESLREAYRAAKLEFRSVWTAHLFDYAAPSEASASR